MPEVQTVRMIRTSLPLTEVVARALVPFPEAAKAVAGAMVAAENPRSDSAEVHPDEIENWKSHGWQIAP